MIYRNIMNDDGIKFAMNSSRIYDRTQIELYDKFNRFGYFDPYNRLNTTKEYVFFTKPDLHLMEINGSTLNPELENYIFFSNAIKQYPNVMGQLQESIKGRNKSPFCNLLSNRITSYLDLPGISAEEVDTGANIFGTKLSYRKSSIKSDEDFDFNIDFEDTKFLEIYMYFKIYDMYQKLKTEGNVTPPNEICRLKKILHDQITIYKFIVGEDGTSLIYWAAMYGCYPKSVPRDALSDIDKDGGLKLSTQWHAQFVEDMDPQILSDFNYLVKPLYRNSKELPLYNLKYESSDGTWASIPYIGVEAKPSRKNGSKDMSKKFYLRWRVQK